MTKGEADMDVPRWLESDSYPFIGHYLLSDYPGAGSRLPSASRSVDPSTGNFSLPQPHETVSLRRQLNEVNDLKWMADIEGIDIDLGTTEGYVAATPSSVPLLDVVRGFHEKSTIPLPILAGPETYTSAWKKIAGRNHISVLTHHGELTHSATQHIAQLLHERGVRQVTVLQTRCYRSTKRDEVDPINLTSAHAARLRMFGNMCVWG